MDTASPQNSAYNIILLVLLGLVWEFPSQTHLTFKSCKLCHILPTQKHKVFLSFTYFSQKP